MKTQIVRVAWMAGFLLAGAVVAGLRIGCRGGRRVVE